jgi:PqqD family protein of HPr-rel-A system
VAVPEHEVVDIRYRADSPDGLNIAVLDTLSAIFHRRSGLTHIVDDAAPVLLGLLWREALSLDDLISALLASHDLDADGDVRLALAGRLAELEAIGLVWRE